MCGIIGYIGMDQAAPILLSGLEKLEYRGYDSAGIAVHNETGIQIVKATGRLKVLYNLTQGGASILGNAGIGHTRWGTHGESTDVNAHPHFNKDTSIAVVHNGIIENYIKLKKQLEAHGYKFLSQTDTEVIVQMLDYYYNGYPLETITKIMHFIEGSYALGIIFKNHPGEIYAVCKDSSLIVGQGSRGNFIASDVPAILKYTREICYLDNEDIVRLTDSGLTFYHNEEELKKAFVTVRMDLNAAEKGSYAHFMLKEMQEQPKAIADTMNPRLRDGSIVIKELGISDNKIRQIQKIYIVACGSAYHTGVTAKYIFEGLAQIPLEVDLASEFRYRNPILDRNTLVIVVSQSGETADSLAALRKAKANGGRVLGIVNVVESSIAREADNVMYTWAGPEIAVATTKAYSAQLIALYLLALKFSQVRGFLDAEKIACMVSNLQRLPEQISLLLSHKKDIQKIAHRYLKAEHIFFIGRGIDYGIALEGSLKLKEITYVHSEAYAAGELKHGTISLIENGRLVVAVLTQPFLYSKTISNIVEVKSRGAFVMAVTNVGNTEVEKVADYVIYIPETNLYFVNSLAVIPLQLFGYYLSIGKGLDVDKPRNLAKSVTVE
ncbi:MAG: glutamine--fructose-6-phosphate transaminase (isomerizing) [Lachnospiraceae bacterium]|nr:glutamine--fructose-6-phosphate transaminase (isomerizing) [Lachnospiraceae bacterium]